MIWPSLSSAQWYVRVGDISAFSCHPFNWWLTQSLCYSNGCLHLHNCHRCRRTQIICHVLVWATFVSMSATELWVSLLLHVKNTSHVSRLDQTKTQFLSNIFLTKEKVSSTSLVLLSGLIILGEQLIGWDHFHESTNREHLSSKGISQTGSFLWILWKCVHVLITEDRLYYNPYYLLIM